MQYSTVQCSTVCHCESPAIGCRHWWDTWSVWRSYPQYCAHCARYNTIQHPYLSFHYLSYSSNDTYLKPDCPSNLHLYPTPTLCTCHTRFDDVGERKLERLRVQTCRWTPEFSTELSIHNAHRNYREESEECCTGESYLRCSDDVSGYNSWQLDILNFSVQKWAKRDDKMYDVIV